jgi:hypothetical protein
MLIRASGYNTGAQEYLEQGNKSGREFTRDELDHRLILDGQLSVTRAIYESIPDHGQDRYLTFTMSFKEDEVSPETLKAVTAEFKQFLMHAYKDGEYNFYAEAHLPKIKTVMDKKTGGLIERKPHIHIIVPRINLLSGNEANPVGVYLHHEKYFEAFQEYLNQKYGLSSPRENVRVDISDAASVLSRYKGDDFYGKNREFKKNLVKEVMERGITSRAGFYDLVSEFGQTRIRNQGKDNEYLAVKLPGDAKSTNLKDTIFGDDFIVRRELKKPPLEKAVIAQRLKEWAQRSREIKYVHKATPSFRERYGQATAEERPGLLAEREIKFYQIYGESNGNSKPSKRPRGHQRSPAQTRTPDPAAPAYGLQNVPVSDVASDGQSQKTGVGQGALLLPSDAHVHLGQPKPGGDSGLRPALSGGGRGRGATSSGRPGRQPASAVPPATTSARKRAAGARGTGSRAGLKEHPFPGHMLNPRRVPSIADIQARGKRLFDPTKGSEGSGLKVAFKAWQPGDVAQSMPPPVSGPEDKRSRLRPGEPDRRRKLPGHRKTDNPLPPYARNPHRVAGIADIEKRSRSLFEPMKRTVQSPVQVRIGSITALTRNRSASTVAAYLNRQAQQGQLHPHQRHALRRINTQYFELRRALFRDQRLTRQDKAQLGSVLSFERLKAQQAIHHPQHNKEVSLMGSAEIRKLITEDKEDPGFSISGAKGPDPEGVRVRVRRILDKMSLQLDPAVKTERERELNAKDLYTRKSKFSQNVHYLDKTTDKTLFVDTGKVIAMRRTGITEAGVAVALQLAKERFGSTLTINGSADFKKLVIEAAAKNGMDIHFTDKAMNEGLTARRAELEIESEAQNIAPAPEGPHPDQAESVDVIQPVSETGSAEPDQVSVQSSLDQTATDVPGPRSAVTSVEADSSSPIVRLEAEWRRSFGSVSMSEDDVQASDTVMGMRGGDHAVWLVSTSDHTPEALSMLRSYMDRDSYRESFKASIESMYERYQHSPEDIATLDAATGPAVAIVREAEERLFGSAKQDGKSEPTAGANSGRKVITGELMAHGSAPYQHKPDKQQSYFATLKTDAGERTVWGVGLADAMADSDLKIGDMVKLEDHGTEPVTVEIPEIDGTVSEKTTYRRAWTAEGLGAARELAASSSVTTTTVPTHESAEKDQEQEQGLAMD